MKFFLSVYEERRELIELARHVWSSFGEAHIHPRAERQPDLVGQTDLRVGDYAGVFATDRFLNLVLATELLEKSSRLDQQLTLLHECIHMDFASGEHKERWLTLNRRVEEQHNAITQVEPTTPEEADEQDYAQQKHLAAVLFLRLPDEIVAEQRLKQDYRPWFGERAKYYVRMRQHREADLAAPVSDVALQPYEAFYELLRIGLFVTLLAAVPELAAEHAELRRLEEVALARLRDRSSAEVCSSLLALKNRLLAVDASAEKLATAAAAYQDMYQMIMAPA